MRRSTPLFALVCLVTWAGCGEKKENDANKVAEGATAAAGDTDKGATTDKAAPGAKADGDAAAKVGVEPGAWEHGADDGEEAVVSAATGEVDVRRTGTESWEEAKADTKLYDGDQLRTGDASTATVALADQSAVEVAEESAIAIGSRDATQDPASSMGVLYGVARFTVADRAEGEGPFLVYTQAGVVATKGTVYGVGVAASGDARVGVENGEVEVAGATKLDAPVALPAGQAVEIAAAGDVAAPQPIATVDLGTWRDEHEARVKAEEAAKFHADRAAALEGELDKTYAELDAQTKAAADAQARAEAAEQANDPGAYEAVAPDLGASVDASFALSLRLQFLTFAMLSHAYVVDTLYVRHPEVVAVIDPVRPRLARAILWNKRFHAVARANIEPMRVVWYVHHPVGRMHARFVAQPIPPFFARVKLAYRPAPVSARVHFAIFQPPVLAYRVKVKKVVAIGAPRVGWYAGVRARVRPAPVRVAWYVRPKAPRARLVIGTRPTVAVHTVFAVVPPKPRAATVIRFGGAVKVKAGAGAAINAPAVQVRERAGAAIGGAAGAGAGAGAGVGVGGGVGGGVHGAAHIGAGVKAPSPPGVGAAAGIKVRAGAADVRERAHAGAAAVRGGAAVGGSVKVGAKVQGGAAGKVGASSAAHDKKKKKKDGDSGGAAAKIKAGAGVKLGN